MFLAAWVQTIQQLYNDQFRVRRDMTRSEHMFPLFVRQLLLIMIHLFEVDDNRIQEELHKLLPAGRWKMMTEKFTSKRFQSVLDVADEEEDDLCESPLDLWYNLTQQIYPNQKKQKQKEDESIVSMPCVTFIPKQHKEECMERVEKCIVNTIEQCKCCMKGIKEDERYIKMNCTNRCVAVLYHYPNCWKIMVNQQWTAAQERNPMSSLLCRTSDCGGKITQLQCLSSNSQILSTQEFQQQPQQQANKKQSVMTNNTTQTSTTNVSNTAVAVVESTILPVSTTNKRSSRTRVQLMVKMTPPPEKQINGQKKVMETVLKWKTNNNSLLQ